MKWDNNEAYFTKEAADVKNVKEITNDEFHNSIAAFHEFMPLYRYTHLLKRKPFHGEVGINWVENAYVVVIKDVENKSQTFYTGGRGEGKTRALLGYIKTQSKIINKYRERDIEAYDAGYKDGEADCQKETDKEVKERETDYKFQIMVLTDEKETAATIGYREGMIAGREYEAAKSGNRLEAQSATIAEYREEIERLKDLLHQKAIGYDKGRSDEKAIQRERIITLLNTDD